VHVGPPKTGTSTIQSILAQHDNSSVVYPKVGLAGPGAHHNLVWNCQGQGGRQQFVRQDLPELLKQISDVCRCSTLDIVVSSETLLPVGRTGKQLGQRVKDFIDRILPHTGCRAEDVEILIGCREHFDRAASHYSELVKLRLENAIESTPDEYLDDFARRLCYFEKLLELEKTGYRVKALNYHPRHTWIARFFSYIGFSEEKIPEHRSMHIALSPKALIAKLSANRVLDTDKEVEEFMRRLRKCGNFHAYSQFIFGRVAATRAEQLFMRDRKNLEGEYSITLRAPGGSEQVNRFFVSAAELEEIAAITRSMGAKGGHLLAEVSRFLKR